MKNAVNYIKIKNQIEPIDQAAMDKARERQKKLIKPLGSLGKLEDISVQFAGITGSAKNNIEKKIHFVFGADNGVYSEGVTSAPQNLSKLLMNAYALDMGSGINVLCKQNNVALKLVDMGIIGEINHKNVDNHKLMQGTDNLLVTEAMPREIAEKAVDIGISYAKFAKENNYDIIGTGEVGMSNTTTAASCIMAVIGTLDADLYVGKGAGLTEESFETKKRVITKALEKHKPSKDDAIGILSKVGGLDIAALTGLYLGAAYYKIPIVIDGVISIAAALLAYSLNENAVGYMFPSHYSAEPGYEMAAKYLKLEPYLHLGMRLGEGTGCPLAMMIIENGLAIMNNMSTFEELSISTEYQV